MKLTINQTANIKVYAKRKWNATKIEISEGEEYSFTATGKWTDFIKKTDADGYTNLYMRLFNSKKREKEHKWFALIGSLNKEKNIHFLIGKNNNICFNNSGTLYCFANDVNSFYWNNFGSINLLIKRIN